MFWFVLFCFCVCFCFFFVYLFVFFLFSFVVFCFVLFCFVLFCFVFVCLFACVFVLFCFVCFVLFCFGFFFMPVWFQGRKSFYHLLNVVMLVIVKIIQTSDLTFKEAHLISTTLPVPTLLFTPVVAQGTFGPNLKEELSRKNFGTKLAPYLYTP